MPPPNTPSPLGMNFIGRSPALPAAFRSYLAPGLTLGLSRSILAVLGVPLLNTNVYSGVRKYAFGLMPAKLHLVGQAGF